MKKRKFFTQQLCIILFCSMSAFLQGNAKEAGFYTQKSVLASGQWVKLSVAENAIYKLTYENIQSMGIDPAKAKIYGYGGWILSENFSLNDYADDLPEVPVWISGNDNKLDPGEFLLFYGKGPVKWTYNFANNEFQHENNPYSNYGFYFITEGSEGPAVIGKANEETAGNTKINTFDDYALHEKDLNIVIRSGRELFGESFYSNTTQNFSFNIEGITSDEAFARLNFVSTADISSTTVTGKINGGSNYYRFSGIEGDILAYQQDITWKWNAESPAVTATITYSHKGYKSYMNYLRLNVKRELKPYGGYTFFRKKVTKNDYYTYDIANASQNLLVFELTEGKNICQIPTGFSNGTMSFYAEEKTNSIREFVLVDPSKYFPSPEIVGTVPNQNLHGIPQADMIIITQPIYLEQANLLAEAHRTHSGLIVEIITADLIYNEFSSGGAEATAYRRLMKMFYDRGRTEEKKPRYLLLFGDGSHDNRMLTEKWVQMDRSHYLLTYQSINSISKDCVSYTSDDYFGYMEDDNGFSKAKLQVAVGRLPVKNVNEARTVVNKIIAYMDNKNPGNWKNRFVTLAGDEDKSSQYMHLNQADIIASRLDKSHPEILQSKIYFEAFKQDKSKGSTTYPAAKAKLEKSLKDGCMLFSYHGHGATDRLDKEILASSDVIQFKYTNLPLWLMSTCDFGRFDETYNSGAECAVLNPTSGAIATIAAARIVNAWENSNLNNEIVSNLFSPENGVCPTLGDILLKSKNARPDTSNKLSYALLGDPALKLNLPMSSVRLDSITHIETKTTQGANETGIQFKSTEPLTLKGVILGPDGKIDTGFNGKVYSTVLDCPQKISTYSYRFGSDSIYTFSEYQNNISSATGSVLNGEFSIRLTIASDILFKNEQGKISFYAVNADRSNEARGSFTNFIVGGSIDRDIHPDMAGPQIISMYLNTPSFVSGDAVNEKPYFVAEVFDTIGINRSDAGVGHEISLSIDNRPIYTYSLNDYYNEDYNTFGKGNIRFAIPDSLAPGKHTMTFRVWNIFNISSVQTADFYVETGKAPVIYDLYANPNPARTEVYFNFVHDRPETLVTIKICVFDLAGIPIWEYEESGYTDELAQTPVYWDLTSSKGGRVKPGIYVYRASISSKYGKEATASKKLIILSQ